MWPAASAVSRAYIDQLTRTNAIQPERAKAIRSALEKADDLHTGKEKNAPAVMEQLDALAKQLEADASGAKGRDAMRLHSLAETLKARTAKLRAA